MYCKVSALSKLNLTANWLYCFFVNFIPNVFIISRDFSYALSIIHHLYCQYITLCRICVSNGVEDFTLFYIIIYKLNFSFHNSQKIIHRFFDFLLTLSYIFDILCLSFIYHSNNRYINQQLCC